MPTPAVKVRARAASRPTAKLATAAELRRLERRVRTLEEALEDRLDVEAAARAEAEAAERGDAPIPWREARKRLA